MNRNIIKADASFFPILVEVWERSVRSSHDFLTDDDIAEIRSHLIPDYFPAVTLHAYMFGEVIAGFIGIYENKVEMLFVDPKFQGQGIGRKLMDFAMAEGANEVDVNEQNPKALAFYQHLGFRVASRSPLDDSGRPFPILHLHL